MRPTWQTWPAPCRHLQPVSNITSFHCELVHLSWTSLDKQSQRGSLTADRQPLQTCRLVFSCRILEPLQATHKHTDKNRYISVERLNKKKVVLTTKLLLTFSKMRFSFSAIASPFLFFTRFFSSFLQAYILPVARTWQAQTWKTSGEET